MSPKQVNTSYRRAEAIPVDGELARQRRRIIAALFLEMCAMLGVFGGFPISMILWTVAACVTTVLAIRLAATLFQRRTTFAFGIAMGISCVALIVVSSLQFGDGISEKRFRDGVFSRLVGMAATLFIVVASRLILGRQLPAAPDGEP